MDETATKKVKVITPPDVVFDQAKSLLVICPSWELKSKVTDYALEADDHVNVFLYSDFDTNVTWLLSTANSVDYVIIDIDTCTDAVNHFLSYILSLPHTYYCCEHMKAPWDLLNKNRFYDFPKLT